MFSRIAYGLSALLIGAGALTGVQFSSAEWTGQSNTQAVIAAAPDWTPPMVAVDDPGYALWGTTTISATASDSISAIASVLIEYRLQGSGTWTELCTDLVAPFSCSWNTTSVPDGVYFLRATALDSEGNSQTSGELMTEVRNTPGMVIDPVPSPTRGVVSLTGRIVNGGPGPSTVKFQYSVANNGNGPWSDIPGCVALPGPEGSCSFNTAPTSGTFDMRSVGTVGGQTYYDVQTDIVVDNAAPTVTVNKAAGQADPTNASPITFTVVFSEAVSGFDESDVTLGGTSGGTKAATVTGSGPTYTVTVTGMSGDGTVTASVPAAGVVDHVGNANAASTSTDNSVQYDGSPLTVTINQAGGQADPTNGSTVNFTVVFNRSVTGFTTGDVTLSGSAGAMLGTVTGSGPTYNVAVTGMTGSGTVTVALAAGVATDVYGNANETSTSTDDTVTRDVTGPSVTINQAVGQTDPTNASTINFTVEFSEPVTGFTTGDVTITGTTSGTEVGTVTGSGSTYNVAVTGMTSSGTVTAAIAAGRATDLLGNNNVASTSTDGTVTRDVTAPTVTINQASSQADPTTGSPINFTVVFSESVTGFETGDVTITGTTTGSRVGTVTGSGATYNVAVTGMIGDGTVIVAVPSGRATDAAGNANAASTGSDRQVTYNDTIAPTVTIDQAASQADPTNGSTINYTVVFSETVTGFTGADVTITGTAPGTKSAAVSGSGTTYNVAVTGMTGSGTVIATIAAGRATDTGNNTNTASTSTDNTVTRDVTVPTVTINQAVGQADPGNGSTVNFTVVFSEVVTDFATGDVTITGTAGGTKTATVTGSGTTYNVAVTGMTTAGTVVASIATGRATDAVGNANAASTSTDNSVTWSP